MQRTSPYFELKWIVQCTPREGTYFCGWESIAAFNVKSVACSYASKCDASNRDVTYRVVYRSARSGLDPIA